MVKMANFNYFIKAVIFDGSGVVYLRDIEKITDSLLAFLKRRNLDVNRRLFCEYYAKYKNDALKGTINRLSMIEKIFESLGLCYDSRLVKETTSVLDRLKTEHLRLAPAIYDLLTSLRSFDLKLFILTDSFYSVAEKVKWFRMLGILDLIDDIFCSCDVHLMKNDPKIFRFILSKIGLKNNEVVFIGHEKHEICSAKQTGIFTISLSKGIEEDIFIKDLKELKDYFKQEFKKKEKQLDYHDFM